MEQHVSIVTLGVADRNRSREFYDLLGWRQAFAKAEDIVFFQAGGTRVEVDSVLQQAEAAEAKIIKPAGEAIRGAYSGTSQTRMDFSGRSAWNPWLPIAEDRTTGIPQ